MARIRTIKPEFWTDDKLTECSMSARLLFIGTWNFADDSGNLDRSPKQIKARVFPADNVDCEPLLQELIGHGMLTEYAVNDKTYLHIQGFTKHQVINRPSKPSCPAFDESLRTHGGLNTEGKGRERKGKETTSAASRKNGSQHHKIQFDFESAKFNGIVDNDFERWQDAYPAIAVPLEVDRAAAWLKANPANKKSNYERFLVNWFTKAQDRAGRSLI